MHITEQGKNRTLLLTSVDSFGKAKAKPQVPQIRYLLGKFWIRTALYPAFIGDRLCADNCAQVVNFIDKLIIPQCVIPDKIEIIGSAFGKPARAVYPEIGAIVF